MKEKNDQMISYVHGPATRRCTGTPQGPLDGRVGSNEENKCCFFSGHSAAYISREQQQREIVVEQVYIRSSIMIVECPCAHVERIEMKTVEMDKEERKKERKKGGITDRHEKKEYVDRCCIRH